VARFAIASALGLVVTFTSGNTAAHASDQDPPPDVIDAARQAGVDPIDLLGAVNTTGMDARSYLCAADGLLCPAPPNPPAPSPGWPIGGALGQRLYCIEGRESQHNGRAVNPSSGAAGWLQWLPATARKWGVAIGDRWSEWHGAAAIAAQGERFFRSQWPTAAGC